MTRVGDKLGRYELVEQLGKGAAGTVFRARDTLLGIDVCVKVLHSGLATQPGIIERFKRELLLARRVAHPSICKIFDIQEVGDTHFLTMEYVKGETLSAILNRGGAMPVADAVGVLRKVAEALGAAHTAGVVHRDIKPGNIIIGESGRVTIVDFGVATAQDLDRLTRAGVVLGSRSYMAPETWQGLSATAAGDVWALGVILYGCVTGRLPYKGEGVVGVFEAIKNTKPVPPSAMNGDVTSELEAVIFKAMCVDPAERYVDANAVETALAEVERGLDDNAPTTAGMPAFKAPLPSNRAPATRELPRGRKEERLHRPSLAGPALGGLPVPPPTVPGRSHEPPAGLSSPTLPPIAEEMSLYAGDPSLAQDEGDRTRVTAPPSPSLDQAPGRASAERPPEELATTASVSSENVAAAFDAAFGLSGEGAAPVTDPGIDEPSGPPPRLPPPEAATREVSAEELAELRGMSMMLGQKVVSAGVEERPPEPGQRAMSPQPPSPQPPSDDDTKWEVKSSAELPLVTGTSQEGGGDLMSLDPLGAATSSDERALTEVHGEPSLSLGDATVVGDMTPTLGALSLGDEEPPAVDVTQVTAAPGPEEDVEATRVGMAPSSFGDPDEPMGDAESDFLAAADLSPLPDLEPEPSNRGKVMLAAGLGLAVVVLGLGVVAFGGEGGADPSLAAVSPVPEEAAAPATEEPIAAAEPTAEPAAPEQEGQDEEDFAFDQAALQDDGDEAAADEAAADEAAADEAAADEAAADEAAADEDAADDDDAQVEEPEAGAAVAKAAAARRVQKSQRSRQVSAAKAQKIKYQRKKRALDSTLAKKGIIPGDVPRIDGQRGAMLRSARRADWEGASSAADGALAEARKVDIDAAFVGAKLGRFNKRYDKVSDAALRGKLKGALKEVGADFSKGRYEQANKKLNRALALMR